MKEDRSLATPGPEGLFLTCFAAENQFQWDMAGVTDVVVNDGSVGVNFRGSFSGSDRSSKVPVASLECKPRDAGGVKRGSGDSESFIASVFAQEVGEMIGGMIAQRTKLELIKHRDQESFVVSMHGTLFYISAAYFSPEYIRYMETTRPGEVTDVDGVLLWVRRSIHFDLKDANQRGQALKFLWALIRYIASGEARLNIVTAAIDAQRGVATN
ncbi:uncharacterized protein BO80DRAFT_422792 [Aspergillus ibericus CBS 121593]|uniref:Uncharacterized protein n=1 Tax=Aspergillus ibericus CBS 121593 TaxID=1448316 RepID=A0A395H7I3_9EURO|nr:hypothetical protein BO80DRAFT_422792 [Aspergillus ibericus CBS 121593]RAL03877.1 hypothetical protein BO80DRAFT_422792 [Aspergillus ibericus CBS 121593]